MENNDQVNEQKQVNEGPFFPETALIIESILKVQEDLDRLAKAGQQATETAPIGVRFASRAALGSLTERFSDLARGVFEYDQKMKAALQKGTSSES